MFTRGLLVIGLLLTTAGLNLAHADDEDWTGFYIGLDAQDGSIDRLSIVPNGDATFDIRMVSTGISLCDPANPAGVITATGRLVDGQLVRENVLLRCQGAEEVILKDTTYTRDADTGILTMPAPDNGRQMQYHPVSGDD
jgi:hypothetical protein